jgi:hypothetical protein
MSGDRVSTAREHSDAAITEETGKSLDVPLKMVASEAPQTGPGDLAADSAKGVDGSAVPKAVLEQESDG